MSVIIEPLSKDFVDPVAEIEAECFSVPFTKKDISEYLENGLWRFFVAREKDAILGYISFRLVFDECHICNVATATDARRRGIGSLLVSHLISYAKEQGVSKYFLEVRESNLAAIHLYERFGFVKVGVSKNHYTLPRENAILMNLE
jgi:ribosomal-protein-alanine N-acetyltransferase